MPILYSFRRCPYAMRARLALMSAGIECELREIILRDKPEHMLEISPKGTVPVMLLDDGTVLEESLDIMLWALKNHDPEHWLSPQNGNLVEMLDLLERAELEFKVHLDRYKYADRYDNVDAKKERENASQFLQELDGYLAKSSWLFGKHPSLADMGLVTFVRQFANVDRDWFDHQSWKNLLHWMNTVLESERFGVMMKKYKPWKEGDGETVFGRLDQS